jgi:hypothetical protein
MIAWLKIESSSGFVRVFGQSNGATSTLLAGSSLAGNDISWPRVAKEYNQRITVWGVAGSSPWEWESFQKKSGNTKITYLVISVYDLNEGYLCDYHAEVVSLFSSLKDLMQCKVEWAESRRLLSGYPQKYARILFPTLGRSEGVIYGLRRQFALRLGKTGAVGTEAGTTFFAEKKKDEEGALEKSKITDWSSGRLLRRTAAMRLACSGKHWFNGPKYLALQRMLKYAMQQGRVVIVVLPVSSAYCEELLTSKVILKFEDALMDFRNIAPEALWIRLDQIKTLHLDKYFYDLVHMNSDGQQIATDAFMHQLNEYKNSMPAPLDKK